MTKKIVSYCKCGDRTLVTVENARTLMKVTVEYSCNRCGKINVIDREVM